MNGEGQKVKRNKVSCTTIILMQSFQHFTYHRSFRWSYSETLREDASKVGSAGAMPEQLTIMKLSEWFVTLIFSFTFNLEDLDHLKTERKTKISSQLIGT